MVGHDKATMGVWGTSVCIAFRHSDEYDQDTTKTHNRMIVK